MTDPRFEPRWAVSSRAQRRLTPLLGRHASRPSPAYRPARRAAAARGTERPRADEEQTGGQPPEDGDRRLDVLELAALHGQEGPQGVRQGVRRQGPLPRGHQRQLRVLREGPPAARERSSRSAATSSCSPTTWPRAGCATATRSRSTRRTSRTRRTWSTTSRRSTTTPSARSRCRTSRARSASATTSRRPAASSSTVDDLFDPKFKGRVTMLSEPYDSACTVLLGDGDRRLDGEHRRDPRRRSRRSTRPTRRASSGASPATTTRPTWRRATCGSRSPTRATSCSCRATTPTCGSPTSRRATSRSTTT